VKSKTYARAARPLGSSTATSSQARARRAVHAYFASVLTVLSLSSLK
jgi:hypothetical protein